jgi:hypothetical protein
MSNHADYSEVRANAVPTPQGTEVAVIRLVKGETAWHPASPSRLIYGPARVDYIFHPDGGVDFQVSELDRDL